MGGEGDGFLRAEGRWPRRTAFERNLNPGMEFRPEQAAAPLFVVTDPASL